MATTHQPTLLRSEHASGLHALNNELSALHMQMLRTGHDEVRPVRTAVLTLVCVCTGDAEADRAAEVVRRLASNHPSRALVVVADRTAGPDGVDADLSLECSAAGGSDQICAESVRLTVRGAPALHLVSVVTPLLLPDVPVVLWLAGAPPLDQALHAEVLQVCERIVLDSDAYPDPLAALHGLDVAHRQHGHLPIGDLAWARLFPWREVLAQSFDGGEMTSFLRGVQHIAIESCGTHPSSEAWLVAGWLASRLWPDSSVLPPIEVSTRHDATMDEGGLLAVRVHCERDGHSADVTVECTGGMTVTTIATDGGLRASRTMATPPPDLHALVGRELQESGVDPIYTEALRRGTELAGR
ncbi:MAG TPA: glucose-6-phosphate dehydrogenase assembly protein OpcA [Candidatus Dormibacteraeota bacterium]|nr:glucose-6-phosphate dehydrogenase assembly protein OpcA [Candidatus Dormibacteraeota bacterium]